MNYITTTDLRTKSGELIEALLLGKEVELLHRSKKLGKIKLIKGKPLKIFDANKVAKIVKKMNLPKLSVSEREKRYREAMMKKHG